MDSLDMPWPFVAGIIIASIGIAAGAIVQWKIFIRNIKVQAAQKERERILALKQENYLLAWESLSHLVQGATRLLNTTIPAKKSMRIDADRLAQVSKISLIGSMETIAAVQGFMSAYMHFHYSLSAARNSVDLTDIESEGVRRRRDSCIDLRNEARSIVDDAQPGIGVALPSQQSARTTIIQLTAQIDGFEKTLAELDRRRGMQVSALNRSVTQPMESLITRSAALLKALREEISVPGFDEAQFLEIAAGSKRTLSEITEKTKRDDS